MKEYNDIREMQGIGLFKKALIGIAMFCPFSGFKKLLYRMMGAKIGHNVYFGPQSIIISNGSPDNVKNTSKIAVEEAEKRMQNMALYESRQMRKGGPVQQESAVVVSSMER